MTSEDRLVTRILDSYGLIVAAVPPAQMGYRNRTYAVELADGSLANLIVYKREPDILGKIQHANYVSNYLAQVGLPARRTIDPRIARLQKNKRVVQYASLYNYLPGATIPWEGYTMEHLKALGKTMSDMHAALRDLPKAALISTSSECLELLDRMQQYFADPDVRQALSIKLSLSPVELGHFGRILARAAALSDQQALHMDFVRGNILFADNAPHITGILDFEKAAWGHPVFDIARTLAFLLIDCKYKDEAKVRKYFLTSGYNKRGQARYVPTPLLEDLLDFFLLHDFYKFLRHNPYESLAQNEHFTRTRDFLLKRNILASAK